MRVFTVVGSIRKGDLLISLEARRIVHTLTDTSNHAPKPSWKEMYIKRKKKLLRVLKQMTGLNKLLWYFCCC